jgi:phosphoglycerol transferase MdoB-like AlkP superfamily enzyme
MKDRALYLLKTYLLTVVIFIIAKIGFMMYNSSDNPFTVGDVLDVVTHGLSLDLSTSLYFLILPFLLMVVSLFWKKLNIITTILKVYWGIVACAFALAFVADTSLYEFWHFKLDASCLQYLSTPTEAMASVSWGYIIIRLIAFLLSAFVIYRAYQFLGRPLRTASPLPTNRKSAAYGLLAVLLLVPVFIIGIRGGLGESTTNIGQVYYSDRQFLNHSAVNPVFSFLSSFEKTASNIVDYDFYSQQECDRLMDGLYPTTSTVTDTLLNTTHPDIVIILMESAGEVVSKAMPRLQQLKQEGISFDSCYANSWRTDRGTVCTLSGYPSFPTSSVMKMPSKTHMLPGIASTLRQAGYTTHYLYGGDINFTNMRSYLISTGFTSLTWMKDYTSEEQATSEWGVCDGITFSTLYDLLHDGKGSRFIGYSTLSSHEPWDVPIKKYDDEVLNAFYYLDQCLGQFIDKLKHSPQWQNTLVILLPDHSIDYDGITQSDASRNRIPLVWVGGAVRQPRRISTLCNQTDLAATLLAQLGLPHDDFRWSRDILSPSYQYPFAFHTYRNGFSVIDSTGFMAYDFDANRRIAVQTPDGDRLERMGKAILQATTKNLKELDKK